jgi:circadian clock protein KaiB
MNNSADRAAEDRYHLRLFVTGTTPRSQRAIANLRKICHEHLAGRCELEIIDLYQNPDAARALQIIATPTLVKIAPAPQRRIVGDLTDRAKVMIGLNLPWGPAAAGEAP